MNIEIDEPIAIEAICDKYSYHTKVPQPGWLPSEKLTFLQRPKVDNPETMQDFAERKILEEISCLVTNYLKQQAVAKAISEVSEVKYQPTKVKV